MIVRCAVAIVLAVFALASEAVADSYPVTNADLIATRDNRAFGRIANSDCVIECTIAGIQTRTVTLAPLAGVGEREKVRIDVAELSNVMFVRGYGVPRRIECTAVDLQRYTGQRMLLCCYWNPKLKMFAVGRQRIFHWLRDRWVDTESVVGAPPESHASITPAEVSSVVESNSLPALTQCADVIVVGRVVSISDSLNESFSYRRQKVSLAVDRVLKGDRHVRSASILTNTWSPWFSEGQTWIGFLRRSGDAYLAVGDCNGTLRFKAQNVYYNRSVRCPYSRNMFVEHVRRLVATQQRELRKY